MRSRPIEVGHIPLEHALELLLTKDKQVVKACLPHTPQEAFADRIGSGSVRRGVENLNRARCRHTSETRPKFVIVITDLKIWVFAHTGWLLAVVGRPKDRQESASRPCGSPVAIFPFNEEEREERSKEEIGHLYEVTGPDICGVIVQKGRPSLTSRL